MNQRQKIKKLKREKQFYMLAFQMACMEIGRLSGKIAVIRTYTDGRIVKVPEKRQTEK